MATATPRPIKCKGKIGLHNNLNSHSTKFPLRFIHTILQFFTYTCAAAVSRAAGEPLQIEEVVVAPPKEYEVRIKIICTSLCHSDITFWRMKGGPITVHPKIFGHEAVG